MDTRTVRPTCSNRKGDEVIDAKEEEAKLDAEVARTARTREREALAEAIYERASAEAIARLAGDFIFLAVQSFEAAKVFLDTRNQLRDGK